jgi:hypothetical protein
MKVAGKKKGIALLGLLAGLLLSSAQAQLTVVTPEQAVAAEQVKVAYSPEGNSTPDQPVDLLQLVYECARSVGAVVQEGRSEIFRVYGFSFVPGDLYQLQGLRSLTAAVPKAELKAKGKALEFLQGAAVAVTESLESTETVARGGASTTNRSGTEAVQTVSSSTVDVFRSMNSSQASGLLRGGRVSGSKFVSLGSQQGFCVIVRYDIPLNQGGQTGTGGGTANPVPPASAAPANPPPNPGAPPIPPGSKGDF